MFKKSFHKWEKNRRFPAGLLYRAIIKTKFVKFHNLLNRSSLYQTTTLSTLHHSSQSIIQNPAEQNHARPLTHLKRVQIDRAPSKFPANRTVAAYNGVTSATRLRHCSGQPRAAQTSLAYSGTLDAPFAKVLISEPNDKSDGLNYTH